MNVLRRWMFGPVPQARVAWLRVIAYGFLPVDMLLLTRSALDHAELPAELFRPVRLARWVHLPAPTPAAMWTVLVVVLVCAAIAGVASFRDGIDRRIVTAAGYAAAIGYLWWVVISMSYGKVDHDHLALVVALFALPSCGRARVGDRTPSEAAAWSVRMIQVAVVAAYFLSSWAKMRIGGTGWPGGETTAWALSRRGTPFGRWFLDYPDLLHFFQYLTLVVEFSSPLLLVLRGRPLYAYAAFFAGFHVVTYAMMTIHFLPHAIFLTAFLPLELIRARATPPPAVPEPSEGVAATS
ncbi:hypothetical protein [Actinocorallia longicatena]|uniref:HTTM domain-containing protein n=1 Tax=Actinocorallia longicatena TaxID=111803 RepID=A0ABP6QBH0_9ACTN